MNISPGTRVHARSLAQTGGTADRATTETDNSNAAAAYEVHVTKADGSHVVVILDKSYAVLTVENKPTDGSFNHSERRDFARPAARRRRTRSLLRHAQCAPRRPSPTHQLVSLARKYVKGPSGKNHETSALVGRRTPPNSRYSPNLPPHGVSTTWLPTMRPLASADIATISPPRSKCSDTAARSWPTRVATSTVDSSTARQSSFGLAAITAGAGAVPIANVH